MTRQFGQFFFLLHISFFLCTIAACNNENDSSKNQQVNKTIPTDLQSQEKTDDNQKVEINKSPAPENLTKNSETNTTNANSDQTEEKQTSEVDNVKTKLQELESDLDDNNTENEALRQHMEVLLKKVQENQNTLETFEQTKK